MMKTSSQLPPPPRLASLRVQRYHLRACYHGRLYWTCPWCANHNESTIWPDAFLIDCTGSRNATTTQGRKYSKACGGHFIPTIVFRPAILGAPKKPADWRVPNQEKLVEAFPLGELNLDPYRYGDRLHRLDGAERVAELEVVRRFIERAEGVMGEGKMEAARMYLENEVAVEEREWIERGKKNG
jgi:hypothetical protein